MHPLYPLAIFFLSSFLILLELNVFMTPWPIRTGFGLDDRIYWHLLLESLLITANYSSIANLPISQITRTLSILVLRCTPLYANSHSDSVQSRGGHIENSSVAQQWIYANHIENTASSVVIFRARCIATEVIRLLSVYSLSRMHVYWPVT
jgi:hypothetical protein